MKRKKVLLGRMAMVVAALIVGISQSAAVEPQLVTTIDGLDIYEAAVDKDNNFWPVTAIENASGGIVFTIYNQDLSVMKEFTINGNNLYSERLEYSMIGPGVYGEEIVASQHVFNSDDKWEVVVSRNESEYGVYNEDGEFIYDLGQLQLFEDYKRTGNIYYAGNGIFYLQVINYVGDNSNSDFYSFASDESGIVTANTVRQVSSAHPNPLPAGQTLTVDLADPAGSDCRISIFDAAGRVVLRLRADEGSTSVAIPSHRVRNGNFVYMVTENGYIVDTGKVIAQ